MSVSAIGRKLTESEIDFIRRVSAGLRLGQNELARRAEIDKGYLSSILNRKAACTRAAPAKMAGGLGLDTISILEAPLSLLRVSQCSSKSLLPSPDISVSLRVFKTSSPLLLLFRRVVAHCQSDLNDVSRTLRTVFLCEFGQDIPPYR